MSDEPLAPVAVEAEHHQLDPGGRPVALGAGHLGVDPDGQLVAAQQRQPHAADRRVGAVVQVDDQPVQRDLLAGAGPAVDPDGQVAVEADEAVGHGVSSGAGARRRHASTPTPMTAAQAYAQQSQSPTRT